MDKPASLATRTLRQTLLAGLVNQEACWPDGQIRHSRVRVLAVN